MTDNCDPPKPTIAPLTPDQWIGELAAALQKAGWEVELTLSEPVAPTNVVKALRAHSAELEALVRAALEGKNDG